MPKVLQASPTPNENAMKFTIEGKSVPSGARTFASPAAAADHPVAKALFAVAGVKSVFMVNDFITVTKDPSAYWEDMQPAVEAAISSA